VHLSVASTSVPPLYFINNQHDFKGWGENQRVIKLDFWPWPSLLKNGSHASVFPAFVCNKLHTVSWTLHFGVSTLSRCTTFWKLVGPSCCANMQAHLQICNQLTLTAQISKTTPVGSCGSGRAKSVAWRLAVRYGDQLLTGRRSHSPTSRFPSSSTPVVITEPVLDRTGPLRHVLKEMRSYGQWNVCLWSTSRQCHISLIPALWPNSTVVYNVYTLQTRLLSIGWCHMAPRSIWQLTVFWHFFSASPGSNAN